MGTSRELENIMTHTGEVLRCLILATPSPHACVILKMTLNECEISSGLIVVRVKKTLLIIPIETPAANSFCFSN